MEVVWKTVEVILNIRFTASITYHESIHGFRAGRGMGTTNLEVKMIQQVTAIREAVLHTIYLNLHKAYDALDRSRCLKTMKVYGMDPRSLRLLRRYWERLHMLERVEGYYGAPLHGKRGVAQGYPLSPTIFNVVVDPVVRHWESLVTGSTGRHQL